MRNYQEPNNSQGKKRDIFTIFLREVYSKLTHTIKMMYWKEYSMILMVDNNDGPSG